MEMSTLQHQRLESRLSTLEENCRAIRQIIGEVKGAHATKLVNKKSSTDNIVPERLIPVTRKHAVVQFFYANLIRTNDPDDVIPFKDFYKAFHAQNIHEDACPLDIRRAGMELRQELDKETMKKKRYPEGSHSKLCLIGYQWKDWDSIKGSL